MSCSNFVGWQGAFIGNLLYKLWFECCVNLDSSGTGESALDSISTDSLHQGSKSVNHFCRWNMRICRCVWPPHHELIACVVQMLT